MSKAKEILNLTEGKIKTIDKLPRKILVDIATRFFGHREADKMGNKDLAEYISDSI